VNRSSLSIKEFPSFASLMLRVFMFRGRVSEKFKYGVDGGGDVYCSEEVACV